MHTLTGIGVSPGIVAGPAAVMNAPPVLPARPPAVTDEHAAVEAAHTALGEVAAELLERAGQAIPPAADILAAQSAMAADPVLAQRVAELIKAGRPPAYAVSDVIAEFAEQFQAAGGYLAERAADLEDLRNRIVARLLGLPMPGLPDPGHPYVLIADDLAPADTATIDPRQVLAIVTERGGPTSHTAILAKSLGLPAVVACTGAIAVADGTQLLVNGTIGTAVVAPAPSQVRSALDREAVRRAAAARVTGPGRTSDGHPVKLMANLGTARELPAATAAEGVGLLRTEFLYLDRAEAPGFDEQRAAYAEIFDAFAGRRVVVRTLDAGADKPLRFATQPDEPNPALGVRGLRTSLRSPELLDEQLAAISAAAQRARAEVWVMAPMVSTPGEAAAFAQRARAQGLPTVGVMIEVPAAALRADAVLAGCDFVSLGTNDLAQYAFAADRTLSDVADLLDPWQPALLDLIHLTAQAGHRAGKPVGVCGEAAGDALLALVLVGLGVTSLSMAPATLVDVRAALAHHTIAECRHLADLARAAPDAAAARSHVEAVAHTGRWGGARDGWR
ncbi:phosphoenolpyruvate--protein phosphotransferase [Nonomuraea turcica]|uniref:phosphoenolpyruvate--protein phosphotransferase n=1 Tax=Nonomuraea sp. G32 TaxID=3067274 RepID=UPI00273AE891|nr:phosphoenolpyruvate--protein phosphotransferase [Nonomuraea sp. G32]MDP4511996.1 phosphoenolpyruvate--protein phosphotransferase [Nonomuraea sp. G32]